MLILCFVINVINIHMIFIIDIININMIFVTVSGF